jgi:choline dehydrogenase
MPDIISGNLNAPTQMMALKVCDQILGREALPPFKAQFSFNQRQ